MKSNKIFFIPLLVLLLLIGSACDNKLEVINPNNQTTADYWQTEDQISEAVVGIYNTFLTAEYYGRMMQSYTDSRSDDSYADSGWLVYPNVSMFVDLPSDFMLGLVWKNLYTTVFRSNQVLDRIDAVSFKDESYKNRLKGQALFLRAFTYWHLVNLWHNVPLVLHTPNSKEDYYPSQAKPEEVWAQLEADLKKCEEYLPKTYVGMSGADAGQKGRATWGAAAGMLAKCYMQQGKISEAKTQLKTVIDSGIYSLVPDYFDNFTFSNENNQESLFEVQFGIFGTDENWGGVPTSNWRQATGINYNYGISNFTGWEDFECTKWFYDEFKKERCTDGKLDPRLYYSVVYNEPEYDTQLYDNDTPYNRRNKIFGVNPWKSIPNFDGSRYYIAKWTYARIPGYTQESGGVRLNSEINQRILRYADILLLYAECINETDGPTADCYKYIQMVRNRVNLPDLATTKPNLTKQAMRDQISHERALELGIEGVRWYDILRWGWLDDATKVAELKARDPRDFTTFTSTHRYLPISQSEIDVNPNLKQNDGY